MDRVVGRKTRRSFHLDPRSLVGRGSEGRVFRVGTACVKVFSTPLADDQIETLEVLPALGRKIPGFAWPTELMEDPTLGETVGFVMELVPGESLESLLDSRSTAGLPVLVKVRLALKVARA